jgi:hypothetical protein
MSFFGKLVRVVSDVAESMKYDTKIMQPALKELRDFANKHQISELQFSGCLSWEDYEKKLLGIKNLDLENKGINKLPDYFSLFLKDSNVESLSLKANDIEEIPWNFTINDCNKLRKLDISHNKISEIPENFIIDSLEILDLSYNNISDLPFNHLHRHWAKALVLSNNKFEGNFEYDSFISPMLKKLDLSYNQLKNFYVRDKGVLTTLKINNNNIAEKLHPDLKKILESSESSFENNPIYQNSNPYEDEDYYKPTAYINHCFNCGSGIHSHKNKQCDTCGFYICGSCSSCFCK